LEVNHREQIKISFGKQYDGQNCSGSMFYDKKIKTSTCKAMQNKNFFDCHKPVDDSWKTGISAYLNSQTKSQKYGKS